MKNKDSRIDRYERVNRMLDLIIAQERAAITANPEKWSDEKIRSAGVGEKKKEKE